MISVRQTCRTLIFAAQAHVFKRLFSKMRFTSQSHTNPNKCVPGPSLAVGTENELKDIVFRNRILDAGHCWGTMLSRFQPTSESTEDDSIGANKNRFCSDF